MHSLNSQILDAKTINISGRQSMLSQRIAKLLLFIHYNQNLKGASSNYNTDSLKYVMERWVGEREFLNQQNLKEKSDKGFDSLFALNSKYQWKIISAATNNILPTAALPVTKAAIDTIARYELPFLFSMEAITSHYQHQAEQKLDTFKKVVTLLTVIATALLFGLYAAIVFPTINSLSKTIKELLITNKELSTTQQQLKSSLESLIKLKAEVELRANQSKIFIEQAPSAIAMFDTEMKYMAASQKWHQDYGLVGQPIIGKSHYEVFPEIGDDWKNIHQKCLKGAIDQTDEAYFAKADGSGQWISWDVRPWYKSEANIGGILIYTADITAIKEKDAEMRKVDSIMNKINDVIRIGTWELNLSAKKIIWGKATRDIHEVAPDYKPNLATAINFYKEGESRDTIRQALANVIENGGTFDTELVLVTDKGNEIWARAVGQAEFENGQCKRLYGIFQDVSKAKSAELAIIALNAELQAILNSSFASIIGTDTEGVITHFNKGAEAMLQYTAEEMIGKQTPVIIHLAPELAMRGEILSAQFGKEITGFGVLVGSTRDAKHELNKWTYVRKDGTTFPVQLVLSALKDENGTIIGFLGIGIDITELEENRLKLLEAKENLETLTQNLTFKNTQLSNFAHIISHNLRAPVSNLTSLASLYKISNSEADKELLYSKFELVIEHLSDTLNNLIETLKIKEEGGKTRKLIYFSEVIAKIKEILVGQLLESEADIKLDFSKAPQILYDPIYLESIFQNLLTNAIKYKSPERAPEITISTELVDEKIKLTFQDNGLGINLAKYGNKLFGLHKTFHRHAEAKGVGLYLTKTHVEAMGGSISAASEVGQGTTFTILF